MRKDSELTNQEKNKINTLKEDIEEKKAAHKFYQDEATKIENKVKKMKQFETFLDKVKDQNQDEFSELADILGRYQQLSRKNKELHETQDKYTAEIDKKTKDLTAYIKEMETKKITINNNMTQQQIRLEKVDNQKSNLLAQRDENTRLISKQTTETGKLLMTINNLFDNIHKKKERQDMITSKSDYDDSDYDKVKNFDKTGQSANKSIAQLKIITQVVLNFHDLKRKLTEEDLREIEIAKTKKDDKFVSIAKILEQFEKGEDKEEEKEIK